MEQATLTAPELIMPDLNAKSFTANGTEYFISNEMPIYRMAISQKLELEFGFGASFAELVNTHKELYTLLNDRKFVDCAVKVYNTLNGMAQVDELKIGCVEFCTLFINTAGEDISIYDQAVMEKKKEDWNKGLISPRFFFQLAALYTNGFISAYKGLIQGTLIPEVE